MFTAALLTIAMIWKQPTCPSTQEWIKRLWSFYTMDHYAAVNKGGTLTLCNSMDGPGDYHAKLNKPVRERQIPYELTYMWNLMNKIN